MSQRTQDHQEQEANPQSMPHQDIQGQAPVHHQAAPAGAAHCAKNSPGMLTPNQVVALQRTVGNRAVQRLLVSDRPDEPHTLKTVQRHTTRSELEEARASNATAAQQLSQPGTRYVPGLNYLQWAVESLIDGAQPSS